MKSARVIGAIGSVALMVPIALVTGAQHAVAHGAMEDPISRSYACYLEGPENPTSDVCAAVVDVGGPQPLYDWMEVNVADAAGRHQDIIPDGELCSAGRDKYAGLDLARDDWPTTSLPSDSDFTFRYRATAPHAGGYEFYITKDGYDPTQPLAWDDLEPEPFLTVDDPQLVDGYYLMPGRLPAKSGRHLIYAIWQRSDSPEAFYACSDVLFDGNADGGGDEVGGGTDGGGTDGGGTDGGGTDGGGGDVGDHEGGGDVGDEGTDVGDAGGGTDDGDDGEECAPDDAGTPTASSTHVHPHGGSDDDTGVHDHEVVPDDVEPNAAHHASDLDLATTGSPGVTTAVLVATALLALLGAYAFARPRHPAQHRRTPAHRRAGL